MNNVIVLNGLEWDTENLVVDGKTHFTYEEAKAEAAKLGKRLPTKNEFEELLKLPHVFDEDKRGMWFAENQEDLNSNKSLFLPAAGNRFNGSTTMIAVGTSGKYWSATPTGTTLAYNLYFCSANAYTDNFYRTIGYTVRCVTDIKQNNMKQEEEKSLKIQIPEGYEIDKENSTFSYIKFKKLNSEYPKSWNEAFIGNNVSGYWVGSSGEIRVANRRALRDDKNTFKYEEQAESMLAYAQLTQLMALPCFNGDWKPTWDNKYLKYCIYSHGEQQLTISSSYTYKQFLAFKSEEKAKIFLELYKNLINIFFQNV